MNEFADSLKAVICKNIDVLSCEIADYLISLELSAKNEAMRRALLLKNDQSALIIDEHLSRYQRRILESVDEKIHC